MNTPILPSHDKHHQKLEWYALVSYYDDMHEYIYGNSSGHDIKPLYLETELSELLSISPLLIHLYGVDDKFIPKLPIENSIYFADNKSLSMDRVINFCRSRLKVLSNDRKGIFHYYHPIVASYFFSFSSINDTAQWLNPLWGVLYFDQAENHDDWELRYGSSNNDSLEQPWVLKPSQQESLAKKMLDNS